MALRAMRLLWKARQPLSLMPQTRRCGRYGPAVLAQRLNIAEEDAKALLQKWHKLKFVRNLCVDKNNKRYGLKVSSFTDESLL